MRGGRMGGRMGGGGLGGGTNAGPGGTGINPEGLVGLGMLGMLFGRRGGGMNNMNRRGSGITVTSAKGGEDWAVGSSQNVSWTAPRLNGDVKVELSRDSGKTWSTIAEKTAASAGSMTWSVAEPAAKQARIRISSVDNPKMSGMSAADFTISAT